MAHKILAATALACTLSACLLDDVPPKTRMGSWVERQSGTTSSLFDVIWTGTRFVAVGMNGTILTSPDGVSWTAQSFGISHSIATVAQSGNGGLIAVKSDGTILASPDGLEWTENPGDSTLGNLRSIVWLPASGGSQGRFVAVGLQGSIWTSPDGLTWTPRVSGTTQSLFSVAWSGSLLVAVGGGEDGVLMTSPDGVAWSKVGSGLPGYLRHVVWTGSGFVVAGGDVVDGHRVLLKSADGTTWWVQPVKAFRKLTFMALRKSGDGLLAMGFDPEAGSSILSSVDGEAWKAEVSRYLGVFYAAASNGERRVVVGQSGVILTSD